MDFLFGIKGKDFVMVCSDTCASQQIITIKHDEEKLVPIDAHKLICISGARCWSVQGALKLLVKKAHPAYFSYAWTSTIAQQPQTYLVALRSYVSCNKLVLKEGRGAMPPPVLQGLSLPTSDRVLALQASPATVYISQSLS